MGTRSSGPKEFHIYGSPYICGYWNTLKAGKNKTNVTKSMATTIFHTKLSTTISLRQSNHTRYKICHLIVHMSKAWIKCRRWTTHYKNIYGFILSNLCFWVFLMWGKYSPYLSCKPPCEDLTHLNQVGATYPRQTNKP